MQSLKTSSFISSHPPPPPPPITSKQRFADSSVTATFPSNPHPLNHMTQHENNAHQTPPHHPTHTEDHHQHPYSLSSSHSIICDNCGHLVGSKNNPHQHHYIKAFSEKIKNSPATENSKNFVVAKSTHSIRSREPSLSDLTSDAEQPHQQQSGGRSSSHLYDDLDERPLSPISHQEDYRYWRPGRKPHTNSAHEDEGRTAPAAPPDSTPGTEDYRSQTHRANQAHSFKFKPSYPTDEDEDEYEDLAASQTQQAQQTENDAANDRDYSEFSNNDDSSQLNGAGRRPSSNVSRPLSSHSEYPGVEDFRNRAGKSQPHSMRQPAQRIHSGASHDDSANNGQTSDDHEDYKNRNAHHNDRAANQVSPRKQRNSRDHAGSRTQPQNGGDDGHDTSNSSSNPSSFKVNVNFGKGENRMPNETDEDERHGQQQQDQYDRDDSMASSGMSFEVEMNGKQTDSYANSTQPGHLLSVPSAENNHGEGHSGKGAVSPDSRYSVDSLQTRGASTTKTGPHPKNTNDINFPGHRNSHDNADDDDHGNTTSKDFSDPETQQRKKRDSKTHRAKLSNANNTDSDDDNTMSYNSHRNSQRDSQRNSQRNSQRDRHDPNSMLLRPLNKTDFDQYQDVAQNREYANLPRTGADSNANALTNRTERGPHTDLPRHTHEEADDSASMSSLPQRTTPPQKKDRKTSRTKQMRGEDDSNQRKASSNSTDMMVYAYQPSYRSEFPPPPNFEHEMPSLGNRQRPDEVYKPISYLQVSSPPGEHGREDAAQHPLHPSNYRKLSGNSSLDNNAKISAAHPAEQAGFLDPTQAMLDFSLNPTKNEATHKQQKMPHSQQHQQQNHHQQQPPSQHHKKTTKDHHTYSSDESIDSDGLPKASKKRRKFLAGDRKKHLNNNKDPYDDQAMRDRDKRSKSFQDTRTSQMPFGGTIGSLSNLHVRPGDAAGDMDGGFPRDPNVDRSQLNKIERSSKWNSMPLYGSEDYKNLMKRFQQEDEALSREQEWRLMRAQRLAAKNSKYWYITSV